MCSATAHVRYGPEADMPFPSLMLCGDRRTGQSDQDLVKLAAVMIIGIRCENTQRATGLSVKPDCTDITCVCHPLCSGGEPFSEEHPHRQGSIGGKTV
jgi:hypothetical protein